MSVKRLLWGAGGLLVGLVLGMALSGPVSAQTLYTLTVDLTQRLPGSSPPYPPVRLLSERIAGGAASNAAFRGARRITPDAQGRFTTEIPASSSFPVDQRYRLYVGGQVFRFVMPENDSTLGALLVVAGATGPCTVSPTEPASPSPGDLWCHPSSGEMQFRADGTWHPVGAAGGGAVIANGSVTLPKLSSDVLDRYDNAVMISDDAGSEQPSLSGHDLGFISVDGSTTRTVTLPGITIEDQGDPQGTANAVRTIDFTGDGVSCQVTGTKSTCTVTGGVVDYADLTGRPDARFAELEEFEETLRTSTEIDTNPHSVTVSALNTWTAVGTVTLPATTPDRELVIEVEDVGEAARGHGRIDFDLLRASGRLATPPGGTGTEGVQFVQDRPGNNRYWIGVTATGRVYFAADEAGNYRLTLSHSGPDVTPHINLAAAGTTNVDLTLSNDALQATFTGSTGGGLDQDAVDARVVAGTLAPARAGNTDRWSINKLPAAVAGGQGGTISGNDLQKLRDIAAGAEVNVNADWDASTGDAAILNKPTTITTAERGKVGRIPGDACPNVGEVWKSVAGGNMTCQTDATATGGTGIPGITVEQGGNRVGNASEVTTLDFTGDGVAVSGTGAERAVDVAGPIPVVDQVPENPYLNQRIILDAEDDFPGDYISYENEDLSGPTSVRYDLVGAPVDGPQYFECYAAEHGSSAVDIARRGNCYIVTGGTYTMPADAQARLWRSGQTPTWHEITDTAPITGLPHWFQVTGLGYADVSFTGYTFGRNFRSGLSGQTWSYLLYPDATLPVGDYTYAGHGAGTSGWIGTPGTCAPWACRGDTTRIPRAKLPRDGYAPLTVGPGTGETITNSSQDRFLPSLNGFDPTFSLATDFNQTGIIDVTGTYTLSGRSVNSIGFNAGSALNDAQLTIDFFGRTTASAVLASTTYDGSTNRGVKVTGTARDIHNGSATLGEVAVYLGHDAGNLMGYVVGYDGSSGSLGFAIGVDLTITVLHTDLGPAATTFTELSDTPDALGTAGQHVVVASSGTALTFTDAPTGGGGSAYTSHTSLATLPTSGMTVGDLHVVTQGTGVEAMVTRFFAVSATQLKCVGGISDDLINLDFGTPASGGGQEVSVPTAQVWHRLPIAGQSGQFHTWDFRFSNFLIVTGGVNNTSGPWFNDRTWKIIDGAAVRGVTAGTAGGTSAAAQSVEILTRYGANANTEWKRVRFGRTANNQILVAIDDTAKQIYPLRIRGSCG